MKNGDIWKMVCGEGGTGSGTRGFNIDRYIRIIGKYCIRYVIEMYRLFCLGLGGCCRASVLQVKGLLLNSYQ